MSWFKRFQHDRHEANYLIVGLGNPGSQYAQTRHNVGFDVCDRLILGSDNNWRRNRGTLEWRGMIAGVGAVLLKPQKFVNGSGPAVRRALQATGLNADQLILIHDDLDLAFARVRVRKGGSAGGHRGVESVLDALGQTSFVRVKVGLGRPPAGMDPADYVLGRFTASEHDSANDALDRAACAVQALVARPLNAVLQEVNQRDAAVRPRT